MNIAEKRLPSAIPITGRRFIHVSEQCIVCCIAFRLLYCITVSVHDYVVVCYTDSGLCGLFSPPQKTANTVPLHTYQRMFFASAIAATDKSSYHYFYGNVRSFSAQLVKMLTPDLQGVHY